MQQKHLSQLTKELLQELGINAIGDIMTILQIAKKQRPPSNNCPSKITKLLRPRAVNFTNFSMDGCSKDLKTMMSMSLLLEFGGWPSKKMLGCFVCCADSMIHVRKETRTTRGTPNHVLE